MALRFAALVRCDDARFTCKDDPDANGDVTFAQLANMPLVVLRRSSGTGIYERVLDEFRAARSEANVVADCSDVPAIAALVEQGVGIGIFLIARLDGLPAALKARRIATRGPAERVALIHAMGRRFVPDVQNAIKACIATCGLLG